MGAGLLSEPFPRREGRLVCQGVDLEALADETGTPVYVYDMAWIAERVSAFRAAFRELDPLIAYSVKANGNLTILRRLAAMGCGADITSLGELYRARRAGIDPAKVVFAGVGKSRDEIAEALGEGIYGFNVESRGELELLDRVAEALGLRAPFAVRVNPDVLARTPHEYTATGHAAAKFGVPFDETAAMYRWACGRRHLEPRGIDVHIGSQIVEPEPYEQALRTVLGLVAELRDGGVDLEYLDIGGGYGIGYGREAGLDVDGLADRITPLIREAGLRLILEPGRSIVGEAGLLLTRVLYVKRSGSKTFVVVDGGMSDLLRPSHYGGFHRVDAVVERADRAPAVVDVVGPICESGDFLARDRPLPVPEPGDLLAVHTVGAYGFTMASNYNGRLRPPEVLVEDGVARLIRRRETLQDLVRAEEDLPRPT